MNGLTAELAEVTISRRLGCTLCTYIGSLLPGDRADWRAALRAPNSVVSNIAIEQYLKAKGVAISESSVRRHRRNHVG